MRWYQAPRFFYLTIYVIGMVNDLADAPIGGSNDNER